MPQPASPQPGVQPAQPAMPEQPAVAPQTVQPTPQPDPTQPVQPTQPMTQPQPVQPAQPGVVTGMPDQSQQPAIDPVTGLPMQQQPMMGGFAGQPMAQSMGQDTGGFRSKVSKKNILMAVIALAAVVVLGLGAYFLTNMLSNNNNKNKTNNAANKSSSMSSATPLSTLKNVSFMAPSDLNDYTLNPASTDKVKVYSKGECSLQFGTTDATTLPGTDLADIVARQIKTLKDSGVTVEGPTAGTALVLKDNANSSMQYSMPTLVFKANKDKNYAMSYYSAVVFSDGTRAFVTRACGSTTGPVQASAVDAINNDAVKVMVMTKSTM